MILVLKTNGIVLTTNSSNLHFVLDHHDCCSFLNNSDIVSGFSQLQAKDNYFFTLDASNSNIVGTMVSISILFSIFIMEIRINDTVHFQYIYLKPD